MMALLNVNKQTAPYIFDNDKTTRFNFSIDWLSFSYVPCTDDPLDDPVISYILHSVYPDFNAFTHVKGRYSFLDGYGCTGLLVLYHPAEGAACINKNACHVIFQGIGLSLARSVLLDSFYDWFSYIVEHCKIVRCDLALDMFDCPHVLDIRKKFELKEYNSSWRSYSLIRSNGDGWTYYLGRRGRDTYFRAYNKLAERKSHDAPADCDSWLRFELELRDCDSFFKCLKVVSSFSVLSLFYNIVSSRLYIPGLPPCPDFYRGEVMNPSPLAYIDPIYKSVHWLKTQVLPTLDRCIKLFGSRFLLDFLGHKVEDNLYPYLGTEMFAKFMPELLISPFKDLQADCADCFVD